MELNIGYSPCPNDTYVFYALINGKIDSGGIRFIPHIDDVESLNRAALKSEFEITKLSSYAFGVVSGKYDMLDAGGAMGYGCGPLVVARGDASIGDPDRNGDTSLRGKRIAIPGLYTTACLLLRLYDSTLGESLVPMPFNEIMGAVRQGQVDAGLIIHESRFTFAQYGLFQVLDLGQWWESQTGLPIPLGCIAVRKDIAPSLASTLSGLIRESLIYASNNEEETMDYVRSHSQELSREVVKSHIKLYVNDFTMGVGEDGHKALNTLLAMARQRGIL